MRLLIWLITLAFFMASSSSMAMQPRQYTDGEKEFFKSFYESCKKSIEENISEKEFQKTTCFAHIKGSLEAASSIFESYGFIVMGYSATYKDLGDTIESFSKDLCPPEELKPYQIARDYVKFVESPDYKPLHRSILIDERMDKVAKEKMIAEATKKYYQSPADLYFQVYACKPTQNGKTPDVR